MLSAIKRQRIVLLVAWFFCYWLILVLILSAYSKHVKQSMIAEADKDLLDAARSLKYLLPPDYHDRARDKDSISLTEELWQRKRFDDFLKDSRFKYIYTLIEKDHLFYFSSVVVTPEEAKERESWYFLPYPDAPPALYEAWAKQKTTFETYTDTWGTFRSVFLPERSPSGHLYLACVDMEISALQKKIDDERVYFLAMGIIFFLGTLPFLAVYRSSQKKYTRDLEAKNKELEMYQGHLESLVDLRTKDMSKLQDQLVAANISLELILKSLPFGVIIVARDKKIRMVNQAALAMFGGGSMSDVVGHVCHRFLCPADDGQCPVYDLQQSIDRSERFLLTVSGDKKPILKSVVQMRLNNEDVLVEAFVDITERKKAMEALQNAKQAAEEASRVKSDFLSNVSHEIRTPLNAIIGFAESISLAASEESIREQAKTVLNEAELLLRLINDLLDHAKMEAGKFSLELAPFHLADLVEEVGRIFELAIFKKGLRLDIDIDDTLRQHFIGDSYRVRQILINLVGNAIKFTERGHVKIQVAPVGEAVLGRQKVIFRISDSGIGIPKENIKHIFESFYQVDTGLNRKYQGSGLGTAIVKGLAEQMNGEIGCESEVGYGTTFWFEIPFATIPSEGKAFEASADGERPMDDHKHIRVLLAEDYEVNQQVACMQFSKLGINNITVVPDGEKAIERCGHGKFDLIMLDLQMPGLDGIETALRLRLLNADMAKVPIIIVTANANKDVREKCLRSGVNEIMIKPLRVNDVALVLEKYLGTANAVNKDPVLTTDGASKEASQSLPLIDLEEGLSLFAGNRPLYQMSVAKFRSEITGEVETMIAMCDKRNFEVVRKTAHKIAGAAACIAAKAIAAVARKIEADAEALDLDGIKQKLAELKKMSNDFAVIAI